VRDGLPHKFGGCAHWRQCYDAIVDGSMRKTNSMRAGAETHHFIVFLGLRSGGQKGFLRSSRK
jgi:hypothetical protein